jgi:3,4-dihydroxy 2-butanone 4-phosphate synthase/GTP cyclohydrolase II
MDDDGTMARMPKLLELAETWNMGILTIETLIEYRQRTEKLIEKILVTELPTRYGKFMLHLYHSLTENEHHLALVKGDIAPDEPVLVRVHSQCLTGDILGSMRCDCGDQLSTALQMIEDDGRGVLLYMRQEGRGIGLVNKLKAYVLQDNGMDTVEANEHLGFKADQRDYGIGAQILVDLGVRKMRLLTNNPKKLVGLDGYGLDIVEQIPIKGEVHQYNERYLKTKKEKLNHML